MGQGQPPSDSISADAQRLAAVNEGDAKMPSKGASDPATQSAIDRTENLQDAAENIAPKMVCAHCMDFPILSQQLTSRQANAPETVTKEEADLLHSREQRAFGETSKGGIASQAQSMAAENEKKGNI